MNPPAFGGVDNYAPAPWLPPTINGGNAQDATSSILAGLYPSQQQAQHTAAPMAQPQHEKGNWLTRLFPTGGGLAGGAGGAALGTAILPGLGTVLGGILGAGLGSAGAKAGENAVEGSAAGDNVLREGLLGAGGQVAGGLLGKVATKAAGAGFGLLSRGATNRAATRAEAEAAKQLSSEFPDAALNPAARKQFGFGGSLDLANTAGIPKTAQGFVDASNVATGSSGYLNSILDSIVRSGGEIDMSNFGKVVENAINSRPELGSLAIAGGKGGLPKVASNTASTTKQLFEDLLQKTGYGGAGSLTNTAEPDAALDLLRQVGKLGQKYAGSATGTEGDALKSVYDSVYKNLKGDIYNRPGIDDAVSKFMVNPEDSQAILKAAGGNQQLADHIMNLANNAQRADDLLGAQSQFVNMGKAGQRALDYTQNVVGTGKDAKAAAQAAEQQATPMDHAANVANAASNPIAFGASMMKSQKAKDAGEAVLSRLHESGIPDKIAKTITPALLGASQFIAHAPNYVPDQANAPLGGAMDNQNAQLSGQQPGGVSPNEQMLQMALVGLQNPLYAAQFAPIVETLMKGPIQQSASANTALQGAQQAFEGAGGGQGLIGGLLSKLGGAITGGPAKTYDAQREQLIAQLSALGIPTSAVPELTNTGGAADLQWQTLQNLINSQGAKTGAGLLSGVY